VISLSKEEKVKEVVERLEKLAKKKEEIDERMKRVEALLDKRNKDTEE
jgi:hypothetical protein